MCCDGRLTIIVDDQTYTLDPGDTISYGGRSLREFAALGDEEVQVICSVTPPVCWRCENSGNGRR